MFSLFFLYFKCNPYLYPNFPPASPLHPVMPLIWIARIIIHVLMPLDPLVHNPLVPRHHWAPKMHHSLVHPPTRANLKCQKVINLSEPIFLPYSRRVLSP